MSDLRRILLTVALVTALMTILINTYVTYSKTLSKSLTYVVTDLPDIKYLSRFLSKYPYLRGPAINLLGIRYVISRTDVLILLDPNWRDSSVVPLVSNYVEKYLLSGGIVVTTLNGCVLLNNTLKKYGVIVEVISHGVIKEFSDYNVSKYKLLKIKYPLIKKLSPYINAIKVGAGWLVIIPMNIVWAYVDTKDPNYLILLKEAIEESINLPITKYGVRLSTLVALVATPIAVSVTASSLSSSGLLSRAPPKGRSKVVTIIPLYTKLSKSDVERNYIRRKIIELLKERRVASFNELWRELKVSKASVSWHLHVLKLHGYVGTVRIGKYLLIYRKSCDDVEDLIESLLSRGGVIGKFTHDLLNLGSDLELRELVRRYGTDLREVLELRELISMCLGEDNDRLRRFRA